MQAKGAKLAERRTPGKRPEDRNAAISNAVHRTVQDVLHGIEREETEKGSTDMVAFRAAATVLGQLQSYIDNPTALEQRAL